MDMMRMKAILIATAALAFAAAPFFVPFDGFDPERYPIPQNNPPVQPAGYAFSIWGLIYLWLLAHGAYGLFQRAEDPVWDATRWPLFISLGVGASWLSVAEQSPVMATILIWVMLISALVALFRAGMQDRWLLQAPIAIYAGWLSAASFVSIGLLGAGYGVILGQTGWAWLALGAALVFAAAVQTRVSHAPEYAFPIVWALVAVALSNWGRDATLVIFALGGAAGLLILALKRHRA